MQQKESLSPTSIADSILKKPLKRKKVAAKLDQSEKDYLDSLLALWVASSTTPVSVVNDEKFKEFLANLNPEVSQDDSIFKFILCKV